MRRTCGNNRLVAARSKTRLDRELFALDVARREGFLRVLGVTGAGEEAAMQQVAHYCQAFGALLAEVHSFLAASGLDNPAKVSQRGD